MLLKRIFVDLWFGILHKKHMTEALTTVVAEAQEKSPAQSKESGQETSRSAGEKIEVRFSSDWQFFKRVCFSEEAKRGWNDTMLKMQPSQITSRLRDGFNRRDAVTIEVLKNGEKVGMFWFQCVSPGVFEVHTTMLRACRGRDAIRAGRMAIKMMFERGVEKLTSYCPACIPEAMVFAKMCGFKKVGMSSQFWIVGGNGYDVTLVELTKEDYLCQ